MGNLCWIQCSIHQTYITPVTELLQMCMFWGLYFVPILTVLSVVEWLQYYLYMQREALYMYGMNSFTFHGWVVMKKQMGNVLDDRFV